MENFADTDRNKTFSTMSTLLSTQIHDPGFNAYSEESILTWIPFLFLLLFYIPLQIQKIILTNKRKLLWRKNANLKLMCLSGLLVVSALDVAMTVKSDISGRIFSSLVKVVSYIMILSLRIVNRYRGVKTHPIFKFYWLLLLLCSIPDTYSKTMYHNDDLYDIAGNMIYFLLLVSMFSLECIFQDNKTFVKLPANKIKSSVLSELLYLDMDILLKKGYTSTLKYEDFPEVKYKVPCEEKVNRFHDTWDQYSLMDHKTVVNEKTKSLENEKGRKIVSVIEIFVKCFSHEFFGYLIFRLSHIAIILSQPLLLMWLTDFVDGNDPIWKGYVYASLITAQSVLGSFVENVIQHQSVKLGVRIRACVLSAIYNKVLLLSNCSKDGYSLGEIVSIVASNTELFIDTPSNICSAIAGFTESILTFCLLWAIIGPSTVIGVVVLIVLFPVNVHLSSKVKKCECQIMKIKDKRLKLISEVLLSIKIIKMYAWESNFEKHISDIRKDEVEILRRQSVLKVVTNIISHCGSTVITLLSLSAYVLFQEEKPLDAKTAFVAIFLLSSFSKTFRNLTITTSAVIEAYVSTKRIEKLLNSTEVNPTAIKFDSNLNESVVIENGSFTWDEQNDSFVLRDVNVKLNRGQLVAVIGNIGCGKSTLLAALLGDVNKILGNVTISGTVAYVPQQPWITNTTIRKNIIFEREFINEKYDSVLDACTLRKDLEVLPAYDRTEIGERGVNLSNGQKQRISLARAVYGQNDIYLMDDPLSAVDAGVAKHIFDHVIGNNGLLKDKTRILVTHNITYLPQMDFIILMKDGQIAHQGTYEEIQRNVVLDDFIQEELQKDSNKELVESRSEKEILQVTECDYSEKNQKEREADVAKHDSAMQKLIKEECSAVGNIALDTLKYFLSSIGIAPFLITIVMNVMYESLLTSSNIWISKWSGDKSLNVNNTQSTSKRNMYLAVYAVLDISSAFSLFFRDIIWTIVVLKATLKIHTKLTSTVVRWPCKQFDCTPIGRILSRFSQDINIIDAKIIQNALEIMRCAGKVSSVIFIVCYVSPILIVVVIPMIILYTFIQRFYSSSFRQIKRIQSICQSPLLSLVGETIQGVQCIRSLKLQEKFKMKFQRKANMDQTCIYTERTSRRWLHMRVELIGSVIVAASAFLAIYKRDELTASVLALFISYAMQICGPLNWTTRAASVIENNLVSVERIKQYLEFPEEINFKEPKESIPPSWPQEGQVTCENLKLRYRENNELILKGISFTIRSKEKVGIVGRTGAGKTSLILALFRIVEAEEGRILIDGVDISHVPLNVLRSKLTIIPQDPVLFSGSLRFNLDPSEEYTDEDIWTALKLSHFNEHVSTLQGGLCYHVEEGGKNFSMGQRQLICLTRALLKKSKILVLDEATASMDSQTDQLIQSTIQNEFKDCTVITIAHRLNTVIQSDRIMLLNAGKVELFDSPSELLKNKNSLFYKLAFDAGIV